MNKNSIMEINLNNQVVESQMRNKLDECLQELKLNKQIIEQSSDKRVTFSCLYNLEGEEVSAGSGNGLSSEVKSFAESIEHLFVYKFRSQILKKSISEIKNQIEFKNDKILNAIDKNEKIETSLFRSLLEPQKLIYVPTNYVEMGSQERDFHKLTQYFSSSGFSFHSNFIEATYHGLLELMERHIYSKFLLGYYNAVSVNFEVVNSGNEAVDKWVFEHVKKMELQFNGKIILLLIISPFAVNTTLAIFYPNDNSSDKKILIPQIGSKCALNFGESLVGSINELNQVLYLYSDEEKNEDQKILNKFLDDKNALNIVLLSDIKSNVNSYCCFNDSRLNYSKSGVAKLLKTTEDKISYLIIQLKDLGYYPLFRIINEFKNECCIVQTFIPGFEKFNLIRNGIKLEPHMKMITKNNKEI